PSRTSSGAVLWLMETTRSASRPGRDAEASSWIMERGFDSELDMNGVSVRSTRPCEQVSALHHCESCAAGTICSSTQARSGTPRMAVGASFRRRVLVARTGIEHHRAGEVFVHP